MISAIIVNYFSYKLTTRAVISVLMSEPSSQVIVVDNSHNAFESEMLHKHLPSGTELFITEENLGFGRACNLGLEYAKGEWILLLNPDAFVLPGCLTRLVDTLQRNPQAAAVSPIAQWDKAGTFLLSPGYEQSPALEWLLSLGMRFPTFGYLLSKRFRVWALSCLNASKPVSQSMLSGGYILLRKQAIESIDGLFDPHFFMYYEDDDLSKRLRKAGYTLLLDPSAKAVHEWCNNPGKYCFFPSSKKYYMQKHFSKTWLTYQRLSWLESLRKPKSIAAFSDIGLSLSPPIFELPDDQQGNWILEISPSPLFIPSAYNSSVVAPLSIPLYIWRFLGTGRYWVRITAPSGREWHFSWVIPKTSEMPAK